MWRKGSFKIHCQEFNGIPHVSLGMCISSVIKVSLECSSTKWAKLPFSVLKIILSSELGATLFPDDYCPNLLLH